MTDDRQDGWPGEYRDPRNRPHPDLLRVTVGSFEEVREETVDEIEAVAEGESTPATATSGTVGQLREILTDRRIGLLRALTEVDCAAESITALAEYVDRDYRTVHDDVTLLADHGLVFVVGEGQAKRPYLPYERIHLDGELVANEPDEEPTIA